MRNFIARIIEITSCFPKAQKYLDGILKIPFGTIKSESDLHDPGKDLVEELLKWWSSTSGSPSSMRDDFASFIDLETF